MKTVFSICLLVIGRMICSAQDSTFYQNFEWSPDGKKIIASARIKSPDGKYYKEAFECYIIDVNTHSLERKIANSEEPSWSADGKYIAYSKIGKHSSDISLMDFTTGDSSIVMNLRYSSKIGFSPDNKRICFSGFKDDKNHIYVRKLDSAGVMKISNDAFDCYGPMWSPQGDNIVYYRTGQNQKGKVCMVNINEGKEIILTDDEINYICPSWLPDGKTIICAFSHPVSKTSDEWQLAFLDIKGFRKRVIANTIDAIFGRVAFDGKKIAFIKGGWPKNNIYIANLDGSNQRCLTCGLHR